jgi:hypothetical protein
MAGESKGGERLQTSIVDPTRTTSGRLCSAGMRPDKDEGTTSRSARRRPGEVRDAIVAHLREAGEASTSEIRAAVEQRLATPVPASSVRSYLRLNTPATFERTGRGRYRLRRR